MSRANLNSIRRLMGNQWSRRSSSPRPSDDGHRVIISNFRDPLHVCERMQQLQSSNFVHKCTKGGYCLRIKIMPECGGYHRIQFPVKNSPHLHSVLSNENVNGISATLRATVGHSVMPHRATLPFKSALIILHLPAVHILVMIIRLQYCIAYHCNHQIVG